MNAEELLAKIATGEWEEGLFVDFNAERPSSRQLLKDVTAFANGQGGEIFIGVAETNGIATAAPGVLITNSEAEQQSYQNSIRDGIKPRLVGCEVEIIAGLPEGKSVVAIKVPRSRFGPHVPSGNQETGFHARHGNQSVPMDVEELRRAYFEKVSPEIQMARWVDGRLQAIEQEINTPKLPNAPCWVIHICPLASFQEEQHFTHKALREVSTYLQSLSSSGHTTYPNGEGVILMDRFINHRTSGYTQLYSKGHVESLAYMFVDNGNGTSYPADDLVFGGEETIKQIVGHVAIILGALNTLGIPYPYFVWVSAVRTGNAHYRDNPGLRLEHRHRIGQPQISAGPILFEEHPTTGEQVSTALFPVFQHFAHAGGYWETTYYNSDGTLKQRIRDIETLLAWDWPRIEPRP